MQIKTDKFSEWYQAHMEKFIPSYAFFFDFVLCCELSGLLGDTAFGIEECIIMI